MNFLLSGHRIGKIFGIEIHLSYSLYLITGLFILLNAGGGIYPIIAILLIPACILAHELGHSLASQKFGVKVNKIVLHMLGGVAEISGLIPGPRAEIIIAAMGPLVSFLIAAICYIIGGNMPHSPVVQLFFYLTYVNVILGLFNLLPIFPMDGGRIALALIMLIKGPEKAFRYVRPMTIAGVIILCTLGILQILTGNTGGVFLLLIGIMMYRQGNQEIQARTYASRYSSMNDNWRNQYYQSNSYNSSTQKTKQNKVYEDSIFSSWKKRRQKLRKAREKAKTSKRETEKTELDKRVDEVLKKVKTEGISKLTPGEKAILQSASKKYKKIFK